MSAPEIIPKRLRAKQIAAIYGIGLSTVWLYAKKGKLNNIKFEKVFWHSIDSHKDIEECSKDILSQKFEKFISK